MFASVGIGSATVNTKLEKEMYMPGEAAKGIIEVKGGSIDQNIDEIYLSLNTTYLKESDDRKHTVTACMDRFRLTESFTVKANEKKEIAFSFHLPYDTPLTIGRTKIWVTTGLNIKNALDPSDKDYIYLIPTPLMSAVFKSMEDLGFRLREADCEEVTLRHRRRFPFVQEFEFVPITGDFRGRLDEIELVFYPVNQGLMEIMLQVDRRARGLGGLLAEAFEMDESTLKLTVSDADIPYLTQKMRNTIQNYS